MNRLAGDLPRLKETVRERITEVRGEGQGGLLAAARRPRSEFPDLRIVVGRLGQRRDPKNTRKLLFAAGANRVVPTLREACRQIGQLSRPVLAREAT